MMGEQKEKLLNSYAQAPKQFGIFQADADSDIRKQENFDIFSVGQYFIDNIG